MNDDFDDDEPDIVDADRGEDFRDIEDDLIRTFNRQAAAITVSDVPFDPAAPAPARGATPLRATRARRGRERSIIRIAGVAAALILVAVLASAQVTRNAEVVTSPGDTSAATGPNAPGSTSAAVPVPPAGEAGVPDCPARDYSGVAQAAQPGTTRPEDLLQDDLRVIRTYGEQHVDEFVRVSIDTSTPVAPRTVAVFTGHVDQHRRSLTAMVSHPDRLDVNEECSPLPRLEQIRREIEKMNADDPRHPLHSYGVNPVDRKVVLEMDANAEDLAAKAYAKYGDALKITVGVFPYPPGAPYWGRASQLPCPMDVGATIGPTPVIEVPGVQLAVVLDESTIAKGANVTGHVTIHNNSAKEIRVAEPKAQPLIVDGDHHLVGPGGPVVSDLMDHSVPIAPGASYDVALEGPTANCVPDAGYVLAPGHYGVIVPLTFYLNGENGYSAAPNPPVMKTPEVPLTIT